MPAGSIKHKHHMGIISGLLTYKPNMMIHVVGVYCRGYHGRRFAVYRIDRYEYCTSSAKIDLFVQYYVIWEIPANYFFNKKNL